MLEFENVTKAGRALEFLARSRMWLTSFMASVVAKPGVSLLILNWSFAMRAPYPSKMGPAGD